MATRKGSHGAGARLRKERFARALFAGMTGAAAAAEAGYTGGRLKERGRKLVRDPAVQAELARLTTQARADAVIERDEVLRRLSGQARGEIGEYFTFGPSVLDPKTQVWTGLDLERMKRDGKMHLLSGVSYTKEGFRFRFADSQGAYDRLAKLLGWNAAEEHRHQHVGTVQVETLSEDELTKLGETLVKGEGKE